jgi:hypothetical protein
VVHDTAAHQIGKPINWYAEGGGQANPAAGYASGKGAWIEDAAWKF